MTLVPRIPHDAPADVPAEPHERAEVARAVLCAGGVETTYVRVGAGATVLVLRATDREDAPSPLVLALADRFRVIAPLRPAALAGRGDDAFAAWLRDLLDGLGIDGATILAEGAVAPAALAFALADPLRVRRVALLIDDAGVTVPAPPSVAAFDAATPWPGVVRFLAGGHAAPAGGPVVARD